MTTPAFTALACDVLGRGRTLRFRAHGGSMRPFIRDGDVVEVTPVDAEALRRGDVVLRVDAHERPLVHRVIEIERGRTGLQVRTRGDAMAVADGAVDGRQILGRVVAVERNGRRLVLDRGLSRSIAHAWVALSPAGPWLLAGAIRFRSWVSAAVSLLNPEESRA